MSLSSTGTSTVSPARTVARSSTGVGGESACGIGSCSTLTWPVTGGATPSVTVYWISRTPGLTGCVDQMRSQCPCSTATSSPASSAGTARCTTSTSPDGSKSLASTSTVCACCPCSTAVSGIATGGSARDGSAVTSTRITPVDSFADPNAASYLSVNVPMCCGVTVTVPPAGSVVTAAPTGCGSGAARVSFADGSVGSEPGTSLASGVIVTGLPTMARATSGSAVAGTASSELRGSTLTLSAPWTGSAMPSVTW